MPGGDSRPRSGGGPPALGVWQRLLARAPRVRAGEARPAKAPFGQRLEGALLKPADPARARQRERPRRPSVEELESARLSDDTERMIGLSLAPIAGLIAIVITAHQLSDNAPATVNGRPNPLHVSTSLTHELEVVLLALALAILVTSLARRRLYTGIATALYGLAVFNLHWWGFGFPFVFVGSWFLVRAYRAQQAWKEAGGARAGPPARGPGASRRYTPPASPKRLPSPPKRDRRERGTG